MKEFDVEKIREDFPMFKNYPLMQGKRFAYLDNGATTFKPYPVIEAENSYYLRLNANTHRGDYDLASAADKAYLQARKTVAKFINAESENEVVFTAGDSMSMNIAAYGLVSLLSEGDEILLSEEEHASNVLPWEQFGKQKGVKIRYIPLTEEGRITVENVRKTMTEKTKIISLAQVSNVLGYVVPIKEIAALAHEHGAYMVVDGAQSVPHMKVDVQDLGCDFLAFSGHKMVGPSGIGVLYGKKELLDKIPPLLTGGGMNARFDKEGNVTYEEAPYKFEAGTQNVAGALGLAAACDYLSSIGFDAIGAQERKLRKRLVERMEKNDSVVIYNPGAESGIVTFNVKGVFAQDEGTLLNSYGIAVRSGLHCAKLLPDFLKTYGTVRASIYFYNDEQDVDQLADALDKKGDFLDAFFN